MNTTRLHPMAEDYLDRLVGEAGLLPDQDREDLVLEIRGHLEAGLSGEATEADVRNMLDDLGSPADIVAAAAAETEAGPPFTRTAASTAARGPAVSPWGVLEILAILGLTVGTFLVPIVGPLAGLILAWVSSRWTRTEKLVATVLVLLPVVALALGAAVFTVSGSSHTVPGSPTPQHIVGGLR